MPNHRVITTLTVRLPHPVAVAPIVPRNRRWHSAYDGLHMILLSLSISAGHLCCSSSCFYEVAHQPWQPAAALCGPWSTKVHGVEATGTAKWPEIAAAEIINVSNFQKNKRVWLGISTKHSKKTRNSLVPSGKKSDGCTGGSSRNRSTFWQFRHRNYLQSDASQSAKFDISNFRVTIWRFIANVPIVGMLVKQDKRLRVPSWILSCWPQKIFSLQ